jgi:hypothetical protein
VGLASGKVRRERGALDRVPQPLLVETVLMTGSPTRGIASLHKETFQLLVHLEDVMRVARPGDDDVSGLYVVRHTVRQNLGFSSMDQPDLMIVVVMAVEARSDDRNSKAADRDGTEPSRPRTFVHPSGREIKYGRFQPPKKTIRQTGQPVVQC